MPEKFEKKMFRFNFWPLQTSQRLKTSTEFMTCFAVGIYDLCVRFSGLSCDS